MFIWIKNPSVAAFEQPRAKLSVAKVKMRLAPIKNLFMLKKIKSITIIIIAGGEYRIRDNKLS